MLVNCPKCSFSQPKDRYCASCGVDMELYKPAAVPLSKKMVDNPYLYVIAICAVVLGSIFFIRQKQKEELRARVEYLKGGPVLVERNQPVQTEMETTSASEVAPTIEQLPVPENTPAPASTGGPSATASATVGPAGESSPTAPPQIASARLAKSGADASTAPKAVTGVIVIYAEVEQRLLNSWMEEMRAAGQLRSFDDVTMGPLPNISEKLKSPGFKILQQMHKPLPSNQAAQDWFVGTHRGTNLDHEMGFFSSLAMGEMTDGLIRGELEIQRAFRDPKDPSKAMERISFGGPFEFPHGNGFVMRGLLPRRYSEAQLDEEARPDTALSILNSDRFRTGQTEFTLILDFDTTAPQAR